MRQFSHLRVLILALAFLLCVPLLFSCTSIQTTEYELQFNSENETKIRILQISDFHSNDFGKNEEKF